MNTGKCISSQRVLASTIIHYAVLIKNLRLNGDNRRQDVRISKETDKLFFSNVNEGKK